MAPDTANTASDSARTGSGGVCFGGEQSQVSPPAQKFQARLFQNRPLRENAPKSKSRLAQICSKLQRDVATLRREVASLREAVATPRPKTTVTVDEAAAEREAAKRKRIDERAAAKREHAEAAARQALIQPEKDLARAEWLAKDKARQRNAATKRTVAWRAANPEKAKAIWTHANQKRKEETAARKQILAQTGFAP